MVRMRSVSKKSSPRAERPPVSGVKIRRTKINLDLRCGDCVPARVHDDAARHGICGVHSEAVRKSHASKKISRSN